MCGDLCGDVLGICGKNAGETKALPGQHEMLVYLAGLNGCLLGQRFCVAISNPALLPV